MSIKSFKIEEDTIDNVIKVNVRNAMVTIQLIDYVSKKVVRESTFIYTEISYINMKNFLREITTLYYINVIMKYIEEESYMLRTLIKNNFV